MRYKLSENGTSYHHQTPEEIIDILEKAIKERFRIRIYYGENGKSWNEGHGTIGYIGRSTGKNKIPLLVYNSRSLGGGGIVRPLYR